MSHHFKAPQTPVRHEDVRVRVPAEKVRQAAEESETEEQQEAKLMAMCIANEDELEVLLAGASPAMRAGMLELIRPYLKFTLTAVEVTPDCPVCGLYRGSVVNHECLGAN